MQGRGGGREAVRSRRCERIILALFERPVIRRLIVGVGGEGERKLMLHSTAADAHRVPHPVLHRCGVAPRGARRHCVGGALTYGCTLYRGVCVCARAWSCSADGGISTDPGARGCLLKVGVDAAALPCFV